MSLLDQTNDLEKQWKQLLLSGSLSEIKSFVATVPSIPIIKAIRARNVHAIDWLIEQAIEAEVLKKMLFQRNQHGTNAVRAALECGHPKIIHTVLSHAELDQNYLTKQLGMADMISTCRVLVELGANVNHAYGPDDKPLILTKLAKWLRKSAFDDDLSQAIPVWVDAGLKLPKFRASTLDKFSQTCPKTAALLSKISITSSIKSPKTKDHSGTCLSL